MYDLRELVGYDPSDALRQTFILYYTNEADKRAALRFVVTDNQGQQRELEISFDPDVE